MVHLSFALSITRTCRLRFLVGKTEGAERTGCWTPFVNTCAHMTHQPQLRGQAPCNKLLKDFYQKRTEQVSIKRFLKRNLAHVGIWFNA